MTTLPKLRPEDEVKPTDPKCRTCNGTGAECGCGRGFCDHCAGTGFMAGLPFDTPVDYDILTSEELDTFLTYRDNPRCQDSVGDWMRRIAKYAVDKHRKQHG